MTHSHPTSLCLQQAAAFRQELSTLMEDGRHDLYLLLTNMQEHELLAITSLCLTSAQLRVPALLQFSSRLFRLHEQAMSFEMASRLCKTLLDASAHDLGAPDRISFSEYLYYSVHYAPRIQSWQIHSIIPSLYADHTPLEHDWFYLNRVCSRKCCVVIQGMCWNGGQHECRSPILMIFASVWLRR
ncbi:MAG: hypothetical protein LKJ54_05600 [Acetobacter peroxydans]|jgi:hypothetical protein|nr:hypothetical protein [Acetobacter peroxydans]MCI2077891.1 hypothetical protein [Acetobacter peroxydans]